VTDFGIFVSLAAGIDGLVHISKLNVERNTNLKKVYKEGTDIAVIIDKIDVQEKRISLSPVVSNEEEDNAKEYLASQNDDGETYNPFAALLKK
jgi:small subunit ribosomal protein S1